MFMHWFIGFLLSSLALQRIANHKAIANEKIGRTTSQPLMDCWVWRPVMPCYNWRVPGRTFTMALNVKGHGPWTLWEDDSSAMFKFGICRGTDLQPLYALCVAFSVTFISDLFFFRTWVSCGCLQKIDLPLLFANRYGVPQLPHLRR